MLKPAPGRRSATALLAVGATLTAGGLAALAPTGAVASSHREAPLIAGQPQYDNTDVYAFVSPDKADTVTLVANWLPFEEPAGGPNFYAFAEDARYNIHVDNDGDAKADIVYRWTFNSGFRNGNTFLYNTGPVTSLTDPDLNFREHYKLQVLTRRDNGRFRQQSVTRAQAAPSRVGEASMPNYAALRRQAVVPMSGGGQTFAGQADDSFFLDLRVFDLLYGGDFSEVGNDTLAGYNVNTLALQVPTEALTEGDPVISVWSNTSRQNSSGKWKRVSRLANPLVNEVVIPVKDKDRFNASRPQGDAQFLEYVTNPELPQLIEAIYGIPAPATPRDDLVAVFLTGIEGLNQPANVVPSEQMRLNTSIPPSDNPNRLGVLGGDNAGFPNGRRLADDVVDIELQVLEGELVGNPNDIGDAVNANDRAFGDSFPYVALPHSGSAVNVGTGTNRTGATALTGGAYTGGGTSVPVLPVSTAALGLLTLLAGAVALRRRGAAAGTQPA
jgi:hypothetical protein